MTRTIIIRQRTVFSPKHDMLHAHPRALQNFVALSEFLRVLWFAGAPQIAKNTGLTRQTVYRIKDDPRRARRRLRP
jgi:hypothetical protein